MAHKMMIEPKTFWQKLLIFWQTKNHSSKIYDMALLLAVGIFTNHIVYKEELEEARLLLYKKLKDDSSVNQITEYIEMKLAEYSQNEEAWHRDRKKVLEMIQKDEDLYGYLLNIYEADETIDKEEIAFEELLKHSLYHASDS